MKKVIMLKGDYCPYCKRAFKMMEELFAQHPEFKGVNLEIIDEVSQESKANQFDYEVVPTYIIDGSIVFAGIPTKEAIEEVFRKALS